MRVRGLLASVLPAALALGAAAPAHAEGQEQGFAFHPSIRAINVYDDEPGLGRPGRSNEGDIGFWLRPRAELAYRSADLDVGADLGVDIRRYIRTNSLADELWRAKGYAEAGLLPGLTARLSNAFVPLYRQLGLPENHGANLAQTNRTEAELRYWRELGSGLELEVGGGGTYFLSESFTATFPGAGGPTVDSGYRADFWQGSGSAQLSRPVAKGTVAQLVAQAGYRDYRDGQRSDHTNVAVMLGLRSERFENVELELAAGYGLIAFTSLGDVQQPIGRLRVRQRLPADFAWHFLAANRFRSNMVGNEVFEATGEIGLEKRFGERVDTSLNVFVAHFKDRGEQSNLYGGVEFEIGYALAAQTRISLAYRHWQNRGDAGFDDMTQNAAFLGFSFRR